MALLAKLGTRILGIDPGSAVTGYGVIDFHGQRSVHVRHGCIRSARGELAQRLRTIFDGVSELIATYQPDQMAVEMVFMARNADSALKLGQARGAALAAGAVASVPVFEYSARQIKQTVVGSGGAAKSQVAHMVKVLLCLTEQLPQDAADALGVAICHGHVHGGALTIPGVHGIKRGRWV